MTSKFDELVEKLKEIFQIDKPELDFGIYKIINAKAAMIQKFLTNDLKAKVKAALSDKQSAGKKALEDKIAKTEATLKSLGVEPSSSQEWVSAKAELEKLDVSDDSESLVYAHLLTFFSRYYDDGDFISKRRYKDGVYALPYSGEEVKLHWANADQYYTKSGENFTNYDFKLDDGAKVHFKLVTAETAKDNIKDNECVRCFVLWDPNEKSNVEDEEVAEKLPNKFLEEKDGELYIYFQYRKFKKGAKQSDFTAAAREKIFEEIAAQHLIEKFNLTKVEPTEKDKKRTVFDKQFTNYTAKNTSDYFIHKDLKKFLTQELDNYVKSEMMNLDDISNAATFDAIASNLRLIQTFRLIAVELIAFMAQIEDFQKKLWLKKKFVVQCDYCITMDRVPEELRKEVLANKAQLEEWERLGFEESPAGSADSGQGELFKEKDAIDARMVDTKFFDEAFKAKLLRSIPDLDEQCDGLLIHSENFQALRLLLQRFYGHVNTCYIDPPYNTAEGEFSYKDNYKSSSWMSMMHDRISIYKLFGGRESRFFVSIDDRENANLLRLLYLIFGQENYLGSITWEKRTKSQNTSTSKKMLQSKVEFIHPFSFSLGRQEFNLEKTGEKTYPLHSEALGNYRIYKMEVSTAFKRAHDTGSMVYDIDGILPGKGKSWQIGKDTVKKLKDQGRLFIIDGWPWIAYRPCDESNVVEKPFWSHFFDKEVYGTAESGKKVLATDMGFGEVFSTVKPISLIMKLIFHSSVSNGIILDYFGGSGTTAHAVIDLNRQDNGKRKYILVEMGEHFDTVLKPRIEKVVYSPDWKDGKPKVNDKGISHCFKYMTLESYEDTLNNLKLEKPGELGMLQNEYMLNYMLEIESRKSLLGLDKFAHPFDYTLDISVDSSGATQAQKVDMVETFNYLIGLRVQLVDRNIAKGYVIVQGELSGGEEALILWRDLGKVDNQELKKILEKQGIHPREKGFILYVNGDHNLPNTVKDDGEEKTIKIRSIEAEFNRLMFEEA